MEDIVNAAHTDEFEKAYREMVKQARERHVVKSEHPDTHEEAKDYTLTIVKELHLPDGYIFKDENGNVINATKIVLEKKKKEYPKTYVECCKVLDIQSDWHLTFELNNATSCVLCVNNEFDYVCRLEAFRKLLICRDAYWKIAGDWKPDYDSGVDKLGICTYDGVVQKSNAVSHWERHLNKVLEFPTSEMRDAFFENFEDLIEQCKELL